MSSLSLLGIDIYRERRRGEEEEGEEEEGEEEE
jgi:hypothetical protein